MPAQTPTRARSCLVCGHPASGPLRALCSAACRGSAARELEDNRRREDDLRRRVQAWYRQPAWRHWLRPSRLEQVYHWAAELDVLAARSDELAAALSTPDRRTGHGPHLLHRNDVPAGAGSHTHGHT